MDAVNVAPTLYILKEEDNKHIHNPALPLPLTDFFFLSEEKTEAIFVLSFECAAGYPSRPGRGVPPTHVSIVKPSGCAGNIPTSAQRQIRAG
jgi:hypothetical protein